MKFIADENVDFPIILGLREDGHEVFSIAADRGGSPDDVVLESAIVRGAVLLTADKDFGDLIFRQNKANGGVLLLRLAGLSLDTKVQSVKEFVREHQNEIQGRFSVLLPGIARIRKNP